MSRPAHVSSTPSTDELQLWGAPVELRDGSRVRLRPGRGSEDRELLTRGFERLSPESRYRRFLMPIAELTPDVVRYLTDLDHHAHEAIIATDEANHEGLGVARYVRDPARPETAEVAVTVIDDWQGKGLGTRLLETLSARARQEGIRTFTAIMLATNEPMMDLLRHLGEDITVTHREPGTVEIEMPIPDVGLSPALRKLLRVSAHRDVVLPPGARASARRRRPPS